MFHSARLKLTGWYLLIIMVVSISFSTIIYRMFTLEVQRFARIQRFRMEHPPDDSFIDEAKQHVLLTLGAINIGVLIFSGGIGYFLAGRTLKPIAEMVDEQYRFISDASHELRTPLTALKSSLEVNLRDPKLSVSDAKHIMRDGIVDVNKLQSLTDALLQLAQYQTPKTTISYSSVQLSPIIQNAFHQVASLAKQKHIILESNVHHITLDASEYGILDLLVILLDNAIKYSKRHASVKIQAKQNDGSVIITVSDHGSGISKKDMPHIFDRFYRADIARGKQTVGGYGLGLSIAKQIVESHHGSISVSSTLYKGSTFTITLPLS